MSPQSPRPLETDRPSAPAQVTGSDEESIARGLRRFEEALYEGGLDLLQPFALSVLSAIKVEPPRFSSYRPTHLGVVVGNSRALWPVFLRHLRGLGVRSADELGPDPLDIYVEELVHGALAELEDAILAPGAAAFAHERQPNLVPIQRVAEAAGLARIGPAHLSVHTHYGPWFALRAVVALPLPAGAGAVLKARPAGAHPCDRCDAPCRRALSGALLHRDVTLDVPGAFPAPKGLSERQQRWLRVRDACPVGREHRYSGAQILYHYDGRKDALFGKAKQPAE